MADPHLSARVWADAALIAALLESSRWMGWCLPLHSRPSTFDPSSLSKGDEIQVGAACSLPRYLDSSSHLVGKRHPSAEEIHSIWAAGSQRSGSAA